MKIGVCSDLHLEFADVDIKNIDNVDVLILSGDILVENDLQQRDIHNVMEGLGRSARFHDFFKRVCSEFPHVVYVAGNHEHYHGDFKYTLSGLKEKLSHNKNLHILDREIFKLNDTLFVGSTLWTDMNKEDPLTLFHIQRAMNDFRCVSNSHRMVSSKVPLYEKNPLYTEDGKNGPMYNKDKNGYYIKIGEKTIESASRFSPEDAVVEHGKSLGYIKTIYETMQPWEQMVVVGHHTPSHKSCHPRYAKDDLMNGGYHSDLDQFILDRPGIKLWTHGHTHEKFDYTIGETRVVCNPRGYSGYEEIADGFTLKVVEV
jgi:predicted phosphodiesterase